MNTMEAEFHRIASLPKEQFVSEEDVKTKIILPILHALGYEDADFNYEQRTGQGYVDVVSEHFPVGTVVETKSPGKKLENYIGQLESYVFHKHTRDRATIAILTDGEDFHVFGVTEAFFQGTFGDYQIDTFTRSQLADPAFVKRLIELLSKEQNKAGAITEVIANRRRESKERLQAIDTEIESLMSQVSELQAKRASIHGASVPKAANADRATAPRSGSYRHPASAHIIRLLTEKQATSKSHAIEPSWLDNRLVGKVDGVDNWQEVRFGLIELMKVGKVNYEKQSGKIRTVSLT